MRTFLVFLMLLLCMGSLIAVLVAYPVLTVLCIFGLLIAMVLGALWLVAEATSDG